MTKRKSPSPRSTAKKTPAKPAPRAKPSRKKEVPFPIVGIGSSAGGLEALEQFLKALPADSGLALVIVQHLDPTRKGIMVELLQRATAIPVVQVKDRTRVQPDHVYVIPPNKDMSILHGVLHLLAPTAPRGLRLPIDFFFRSLADDRPDHCIGVILSGMGTDGTLGLRAIKEKGGAVFVQEPSSAKFSGMPQSVVGAGLADIAAPVEALPAKILAFLRHDSLIPGPALAMENRAVSGLEKVFILLRSQTSHDFSLYKKTTVYRRIERRMHLHQIAGIANYVRYLQGNPQELELLFNELLIGVTSFFRDPAAWDHLRDEAIPSLLVGRPPSQTMRAWVPGCSTGEEAYSLAIVFQEALEKIHPKSNGGIQIFATDLHRDSIDKAREGIFPVNIAADVSAERLDRYFVQVEQGYQVAKSIRERVIFAPQNLIMDPPFTKLDILSCRNLLIYLTAELQEKLIPLFHYSLNPGGLLLLGSAETIGGFTDLFKPLDRKSRIYKRTESVQRAEPVEFPSSFTRISQDVPNAATPQQHEAIKPSIETLTERLLVRHFSPGAVLVSGKGDVLYFSGRTGKYLEPVVGKANLNIFAMARPGLSFELSGAFQKALREKAAVTIKNAVVGTNGGKQAVDVTVQPLTEPEELRGAVLIVFADVVTPAAAAPGAPRASSRKSSRGVELEQELRQARQELQTTREELQTFQEEARSAHEELQSTNEELQSTNEELTTSKEEMQSLNEELQSVNHELQTKVDDLARSNNDMKNLLDSVEVATVFLDKELRLRRFTNQATKIIRLIPGDTGRPFTDLVSDLHYSALADDAGEVLRTLIPAEKQVSASDGRWFAVRIMPYRTLENMIDGVVITFVDITASKKLEAQLRKTQAGLELHVVEQDAKLDQAEKTQQAGGPRQERPNGSGS